MTCQILLSWHYCNDTYNNKNNNLMIMRVLREKNHCVLDVPEYDKIDRNRTVEKQGLQLSVPVFRVYMSGGGPYCKYFSIVRFSAMTTPLKYSPKNFSYFHFAQLAIQLCQNFHFE